MTKPASIEKSHPLSSHLFFGAIAFLTAILLWMFVNTILHTFRAAHLPNGAAVTIVTPQQAALAPNADQTATVKIKPNNPQYQITAFNLILKATGTLTFNSATTPTVFAGSAEKQLFHQVSADTIRLTYTVFQDDPVPEVEFDVSFKGTQGEGSIVVDEVESEVVGTVPDISFVLDEVDKPAYTFGDVPPGGGGNGGGAGNTTAVFEPATIISEPATEQLITLRVNTESLQKPIFAIALALEATGQAAFTRIGSVSTGYGTLIEDGFAAKTISVAYVFETADISDGASMPRQFEIQVYVQGAEAGEGTVVAKTLTVADNDARKLDVVPPPAVSLVFGGDTPQPPVPETPDPETPEPETPDPETPGSSGSAPGANINVEVHTFPGSGNGPEGRYEGYIQVTLDDGTVLLPWKKTGLMSPTLVTVPSGHTGLLYWRGNPNGSDPPYTIDTSLCGSEGAWALTEDYRSVHDGIPEIPRDAGRRSIGAYCSSSGGSGGGSSNFTFSSATNMLSLTQAIAERNVVKPVPTPVPVPMNLSLRLSLQGTNTTASSDATQQVNVSLLGPTSITRSVTMRRQSDGTYAGVMDVLGQQGGGYALLLKGPYHLQRRICNSSPVESVGAPYKCETGNITLAAGKNVLDLTNIELKVGDLPKQDGVLDSLDLVRVRQHLGGIATNDLEQADINGDGIVDTQDLSLVLQSMVYKFDEK